MTAAAAAMAVVAKGDDCFHSYMQRFSLLCHIFLWLKFICEQNATQSSKETETAVEWSSIILIWNTPQWCWPLGVTPCPCWLPHHVAKPPEPTLKMRTGMQIELNSAVWFDRSNLLFLFFIPAVLQPRSTVNKSNGMRDSIKDEPPMHNMWPVVAFKGGGAG